MHLWFLVYNFKIVFIYLHRLPMLITSCSFSSSCKPPTHKHFMSLLRHGFLPSQYCFPFDQSSFCERNLFYTYKVKDSSSILPTHHPGLNTVDYVRYGFQSVCASSYPPTAIDSSISQRTQKKDPNGRYIVECPWAFVEFG